MGLNKDRTPDETTHETLSALMDSEVSELELRRLLKQLPSATPETLAKWQRYHLVSSAVHGEPVSRVSAESTRSILDSIAAEPAYQGTGKSTAMPRIATPWMEKTAKFAIAASVALAVFVGLQSTLVQDFDAPGASSGMMAGDSPADQMNNIATVDADAQRRLNDYIQRVSIQYSNEPEAPSTSVFEEFPLLVPVNQIEYEPVDGQ